MEFCGSCHTKTLSEWRLTGHAAAEVGCMDCHEDDMGDYLEDLHIKKGIGCVDCHALVIPPEVTPEDGIVPTGHSFTIKPATCVACHTDTLHAGFSLPGYENGAAEAANEGPEEPQASPGGPDAAEDEQNGEALTAEQQLEALQAASTSRTVSALFQGGVVGIALGGTTAWILAHNGRRSPKGDEKTPATENNKEKKSN